MVQRFVKLLSDWIDPWFKVVGAIAVTLGILSAIPIIDRLIKITTGTLFGMTGAVYYEVGDWQRSGTLVKDSALIKTKGRVDGGLFLLRGGERNFENLNWGDVLQVAIAKKSFRAIPEANDFQNVDFKREPEIFLLSQGQCVVVHKRLRDVEVVRAKSGGWLKVSTSACKLFN